MRQRWPTWASWCFVASGVWMAMLYFGVVDAKPTRRNALLQGYQHWQVLSAAIAFSGVGVSLLLQRFRFVARVIGLIAVANLLAVLLWALLFSSAPVPVFVQLIAALILVVTIAGIALGQAYRIKDPIRQAEVLRRYGRRAQAQALLVKASQNEPHRIAEYRDAMNRLKSGQRITTVE
jgi:hypothetical protein